MTNIVEQTLQTAFHLLQQGNFDKADLALKEVEHHPNYIHHATLLRAQYYFAQGDYDRSEQALEQLAYADDLPPVLIEPLTHQLNRQEQFFPLARLLKLRMTQADAPQLRFQYALCLMKIGQVKKALKVFAQLKENGFNHPKLNINLGHAYKAFGDVNSASIEYKEAISAYPESAGSAFWSIADLKAYYFSQAEKAQLSILLKSAALPARERALCQFTMARVFEQEKDFSSAFEALSEANKTIAQTRPFNHKAYRHLLSSLQQISLCENEMDDAPQRMVFIVGMPRSGTTLVEQILASHSEVATSDELPFLERLAMQMCRHQSYANAIHNLNSAQQQRFKAHYMAQINQYEVAGKSVIIDKNPNNWMHCALISKLFPSASIINLSRPAADNLMSMYKQYFSVGQDFSFDLNALQQYIRGYYETMIHWCSEHKEGILNCDYQHLVQHPKEATEALLHHCNLPFETQCLRFFENDRAVLTPSASQVKQPVNKKSLQSSAPYISFLQHQGINIKELEDMRLKLLQTNAKK